MLFTSVTFALFLLLVFILYWFVFNGNLKIQNLNIFHVIVYDSGNQTCNYFDNNSFVFCCRMAGKGSGKCNRSFWD